jgi:hypothetical protein
LLQVFRLFSCRRTSWFCLNHFYQSLACAAQIKAGTWYDPETKDRKSNTGYHEIVAGETNKHLGRFSMLVNIIALGGLAVAQIIASSSNFHRLIPGVNKRCGT